MALGWLAGGESFTILHGLEPAESAALLDLLDRHQPKRQIPDLGLQIFFPLSPLPILSGVLDFQKICPHPRERFCCSGLPDKPCV